MPLVKGASQRAFERNLRMLIHEGYPQKQALAIAFDVQRRAKKKRKPRRRR